MALLKIKKSDGSWGLVGGEPLELDTSLTQSKYAADAKAVGDSIAEVKNSVISYTETQDLTEEQKTQALTNLGVYAQDDEPTDAEVGTLWIDTDDEGGSSGGSSVYIDETLTQEGWAAEAKAVGNAINSVNGTISEVREEIAAVTENSVSKAGATMEGTLIADEISASDLTVAQVRNIYAGTADLEAGVSALPAGTIYLVYEG